jgi:uncharacterized membrane protein
MALEVANLTLAAFMAGVIWLVQVVVYPGFARVGAAEFAAFHAAHSRRITPVVAPPMLAHPVVALALLLDRPGALAAANLALAAGMLAVTAVVFARDHAVLGPEGVARLVARNRWRTAGWTAALGTAVALALSA